MPQTLRRDPALVPLSHQHQHGLALTVFIERGLAANPTRAKALELAAKVARLAEIELLGHFRVEEQTLFPAVRPYGGATLVDGLVADHRAMEDLVRRLARSSDRDRIPLLTEFWQLLRRHIRTEERELFEAIQAKIEPDRLAALGEEVAAAVERACPLADDPPAAEREA